MEIIDIEINQSLLDNDKIAKKSDYLNRLITELRTREIPDDFLEFINAEISKTKSLDQDPKKALKQLRGILNQIFRRLEKDLKIVRKGHYRSMWMVLGMSLFGIPFGVAFGVGIGNMGLLAIGLPIGMGIGIALGTAMDGNTKKKGNQLEMTIEP